MNINENFRYLHMGLPEDILRRKLGGDFEGAVRLIDRRLQSPETPEVLRRCLTAEREMILRLPGDYPFTREQALARAREKIPDFTEEEFDERVDSGKIGWIYQKGEMRFFDRFFERSARRSRASRSGPGWLCGGWKARERVLRDGRAEALYPEDESRGRRRPPDSCAGFSPDKG